VRWSKLLALSMALLLSLGLLSGLTFNFTSLVHATGQNWLNGWSYQQSHVINPAIGAGTNYDVKLNVYYGSGTSSGSSAYCNGHCRTDFGDIRFTAADGVTLLNYWMQSYTAGVNATFWVQIPGNLSSSSQTIYMYYGNSAATTTSNGPNTFPLFEQSPSPAYKWVDDTADNPVLTPSSGQWDSGAIDQCSVIYVNGTYFLYYEGDTSGNIWTDCQIGVATSTDGIHWTKYSGNPIISRTGSGWFNSLMNPVVCYVNSTFYMVYMGVQSNYTSAAFLATSKDGFHFTPYSSSPVLDDNSAWVGRYVETASLSYFGGYFYLYYNRNAEGGALRSTGVARSTNCITWTKCAQNPVLTTSAAGYGTGSTACVICGKVIQWGAQYLYIFAGSSAASSPAQLHLDMVMSPTPWFNSSDEWSPSPNLFQPSVGCDNPCVVQTLGANGNTVAYNNNLTITYTNCVDIYHAFWVVGGTTGWIPLSDSMGNGNGWQRNEIGTWDENSGSIENNGNAGNDVYLYSNLATRNIRVFATLSAPSGYKYNAELDVRASGMGSSTDSYNIIFRQSTNDVRIFKVVNRAFTEIGVTVSQTMNNGANVEFDVYGTSTVTLVGYVNGVAVINRTDSSSTLTSGVFSLGAWEQSSASWVTDFSNIYVTPFVSPGPSQGSWGSIQSPVPVTTISPSTATLNVGQSQTFNSTVSGSSSVTPPYSYQWYLNGIAVSGATSSSWTFTPLSTGSDSVYVDVVDSLGYSANSNAATAYVMGWLSGWSYRQSHVINAASGAGINYDLKLYVYYGSGTSSGSSAYCNGLCRTDFGDIRFTAADGVTLLNYWMQSYTASVNATFWVQIPGNLSSSSQTIYMYYGNSAATINGISTFPLLEGSPSPAYQWVVDSADNPVLSPGSSGQWDSGGVDPNTVIYVNGTYFLYYTGDTTGNCWVGGQIGVATSTDGIHWTKYSSNPIVQGTGSGWGYDLINPSVCYVNKTFYMIYTGLMSNATSAAFLATSTNGLTFTPYSSNPVLDDHSAWQNRHIETSGMSYFGGYFYLYYTANAVSGLSRPGGVARSANCITWTTCAQNPVLTSAAAYGTGTNYILVSGKAIQWGAQYLYEFLSSSGGTFHLDMVMSPTPWFNSSVEWSPSSNPFSVSNGPDNPMVVQTLSASGNTIAYQNNLTLTYTTTSCTYAYHAFWVVGGTTGCIPLNDSFGNGNGWQRDGIGTWDENNGNIEDNGNAGTSVFLFSNLNTGNTKAFATLSAPTGDHYNCSLIARASGTGGNVNCYACLFNQQTSSVGIFKVAGGVFAEIGAAVSQTLSNGANVEFDVYGTSTVTLVGYVNGVAVINRTDSSAPYTTGVFGLEAWEKNSASCVSDFSFPVLPSVSPGPSQGSWGSVQAETMPTAAISPGSATLDVGQSVTFTSTASGGTPPYSYYQWYLNGIAVSGATSSSWTFTSSSTGLDSVYVNVFDSLGYSVDSNTASITVNTWPSVTISPSTTTLDVGQSVTFTSTVSGGTLPYSYQWYLNGVSQSGATGSWMFTPTSSGSYTVYLGITDSATPTANTVTSNTATVSVSGVLSVSASPSSATLDVGQSVTFTSAISGGTSSYSYQWYLNGNPVSGATNPTWTFTPSSATSYTIYVKVVDSVGMQVASNTVTVTVNSALSVAISPTSVIIDVGQSVTFASAVSGGTSSYSYQWYLNGVAVTGATGATWTYTLTSAASYAVYLKVADSAFPAANIVKSNNATVSVSSSLSVTVSPGLAGLDVGQSVTFTSAVSGGTLPYSYQWYLNGILQTGATGSSWTYTFTSSGSYTVYLKVTDAVSGTAISNAAAVTVNVASSVTVSPGLAGLDVGQSVTFTSAVSGGTLPYSYQWYLNGVSQSGATGSWSFTPTSSGSYTVYVTVTDAVGIIATSNVATVTVGLTPSVSVSPGSAALDAGASQTFTSAVSGGTLPYSYQWYLNGSAVAGATGSSWTCTFTYPGSYNVYVVVIDVVGGSATSNTATVTVNVKVTFAETGVGSDFTGTVLIVDGINYGVSAFPLVFWWYIGSSHSFAFQSPLVVSANAKQYVWTSSAGLSTMQSWTITASASGNVTGNYVTQYYLTVASTYGSPTPTSGWFNSGASVTESVASPVSGAPGTQYVCTGWTGTGDVPASGSGTTVTFTVTQASTITWKWQTQYLTVPSIIVYPSSTAVPFGTDCTVYINVTTVSDLYAWEFQLNYNPTILNLTSASIVPGGLNEPTQVFYNVANQTSGHLWWAVSTELPTTTGMSYESHAIFEMTFQTIGIGTSNLGLSGTILTNSTDSSMVHAVVSGTITVQGIDLTVTGINIDNHGCSIYANDTYANGTAYDYPVEVTIRNLGNLGAGAFYTELDVYWTTGSLSQGSEEIYVPSLAAGTSAIINFTCLFYPLHTGYYQLTAIVDSQNNITETTRANNTLVLGNVPVTVMGDINGDGVVNILDAVIIAQAWGSTPSSPNWNIRADLNHDGKVDILDAVRIGLHWGETSVFNDCPEINSTNDPAQGAPTAASVSSLVNANATVSLVGLSQSIHTSGCQSAVSLYSGSSVAKAIKANNTFAGDKVDVTMATAVSEVIVINIPDSGVVAEAWQATPTSLQRNIKANVNQDGSVEILDTSGIALR